MPRGRAILLLLLAGCAAVPRVALERAEAEAQAGHAELARSRYDAIAARKDVSDAERIAALMGAARASDALGDADGARVRLERAVERDVPGVVEPAEYELAERLRDHDRARALSLYYRTAGGSEKYRAGGFPYRAAMDRILQISLSETR